MNVRPDVVLDKAQFFAWAEHQERKFELADGKVILLPNVTRGHNRICMNILRALATRLDSSRYDVSQGDFAVETGDRSVRYADVMVEPLSNELSARTTNAAIALFEVLSSSTMHIDFHEKLEEYQALPTLGSYVICAQDEPRVWVWTRAEGRWPEAPVVLEGRDGVLDLPVLGIRLPLADVFQNIGG